MSQLKVKPSKLLAYFVVDVVDEDGDTVDELTLSVPGQQGQTGQAFTFYATAKGGFTAAGTKEDPAALQARIVADAEREINAAEQPAMVVPKTRKPRAPRKPKSAT